MRINFVLAALVMLHDRIKNCDGIDGGDLIHDLRTCKLLADSIRHELAELQILVTYMDEL